MSHLYPDLAHQGYLIIRHLRIENANTIASPLSYGFPALSGFIGAVHALSRRLAQTPEWTNIRLDGCLVACRDIQVQRYRENRYSNYTFNQTRNPILKDGSTAPIIEAGRCHLNIDLVIGVYGELLPEQQTALAATIAEQIQQQRIAGGSVVGIDRKHPVTYCDKDQLGEHKKRLMPAFILTNAHEQLAHITKNLQTQNPKATAIDALIETAVIHHIPEDSGEWHSESIKTGQGWLVPIPIGYQGISPIIPKGELQNSRNPEYSAQYVETIYSLGRWTFPNRIAQLSTAVWYPQYHAEQNLYLINTIKKGA